MNKMYDCNKAVFSVGILQLSMTGFEIIRLTLTTVYSLFVSKTPLKSFTIINAVFMVFWTVAIPVATIYSTVVMSKNGSFYDGAGALSCKG